MSNKGYTKVQNFVVNYPGGFYEATCYLVPEGTEKLEPRCDDCEYPTDMLCILDLVEQEMTVFPHTLTLYQCSECGSCIAYTYPMQSITVDNNE